jgi:cytidine deaminase
MKAVTSEQLEKLRSRMSLVIAKKGKEKTGSVSLARTKNGAEFFGGSVASDSHLLDVTSEQVALSMAKNRNDLFVEQVVTVLDTENTQGSTLVAVKILADYAYRIGSPVAYTLYDASGHVLLQEDDVRARGFYKPHFEPLQERLQDAPSLNTLSLVSRSALVPELKKAAVHGVTRNFSSRESASGYGVSVLLENGTIVFGGQYGSYDSRLGMHAEMSVVLDALMNFPGKKITDLTLVSTKFTDEPCNICGVCLQFLAEMSDRFSWDIQYHCAAFEKDAVVTYTLNQLLPHRWTSKNW